MWRCLFLFYLSGILYEFLGNIICLYSLTCCNSTYRTINIIQRHRTTFWTSEFLSPVAVNLISAVVRLFGSLESVQDRTEIVFSLTRGYGKNSAPTFPWESRKYAYLIAGNGAPNTTAHSSESVATHTPWRIAPRMVSFAQKKRHCYSQSSCEKTGIDRLAGLYSGVYTGIRIGLMPSTLPVCIKIVSYMHSSLQTLLIVVNHKHYLFIYLLFISYSRPIGGNKFSFFVLG